MKNSNPFLICKDHSVSKETFELKHNKEFDMLVTQPQPSEKELSKYYQSEDYISHTDANKSLIEKAYQIIKKHALKNKLQLLNSLNTENKTLLDIGSGTGDFLSVCEKGNWEVTGVEPNLKARNFSSYKLHNKSTNKIKSDLSEIKNTKFDVITLWHVLEHIPNLEEYIYQLKQLLKPNGFLIIAVPNYKSFDAKHYKEFWAAYDVPRHLWHFSKNSIKVLFEKQQMKIENIIPMKFDSFYISILSEKYKNNKNNFIKAFYIGLVSNLKALSTKEYSSLTYIIKND